jgi:hypothetical protein
MDGKGAWRWPTSRPIQFMAGSGCHRRFRVSNFAQTPSRRASRSRLKNLLGCYFKVTQVQQISSVRQKFGYFGMMAAILIVTAALCWGLAHI